MAELSGKAALAVVEFAVHDDTDGQAASEVEVEYVHLVFGFAVGVFGIASGPGVVFEQYADADALFDHIAQGLFARSEIAVTASCRGIDASADADTHSEDFRAFHTARIDEMCDIRADFFEALRAILQFEVGQEFLFDDIVVQVRDEERHVVPADIDACEIDGRAVQSEDVGTSSTRSFDLAQIGDDVLLNEFLNELGDGRYADVQLFGKLRERTLPVHRHMCDDISLEEVVLVRNTFQIVIFLSAEKFG